MSSKLIQLDRSGLLGLSSLIVGFVNLIFFSNENMILFGIMMVLGLISVFLIYKDRKEKDALKIFVGLSIVYVFLIVSFLFFS